MNTTTARIWIVRLVSLSLMSLCLAQGSNAAMIGTQQVVQSEARQARIANVETFLAREDVAQQLIAYGADPAMVKTRVGNMTDSELIALQGNIDQQVAGADGVIAVLGVVFLVLIILEIIGVTNVFGRN